MNIDDFVTAVVSLSAVLALLGLIAWGVRRFAPAGLIGSRSSRSDRLEIADVLHFDARSRLYLIRRDDSEFLLFVSPSGALRLDDSAAAVKRRASSPASAAAGGAS